MENQEKVTKEEIKGIDFEAYVKEQDAPVTRGELADILSGVMNIIGDQMDEVAQPALSVVSALNILISILKEKGIVNHDDFIKAEKSYRKELKEVNKNG